jgi:phage anti-repressor protein
MLKVFGSHDEPIPIEQGKLGLEVNSVLLHQKLKIQTPHRDWIRRRIQEYKFLNGSDFIFAQNCAKIKGIKYQGRTRNVYTLSLDMAKELAMIENNETGRAIRRYFIEMEKGYRDWIGFILPKLAHYVDLFSQREGYNYLGLLICCGCSTQSGSVSRRIRKYPMEFWRDQDNIVFVSEQYGKTIIANAVTRRLNDEVKQRHLAYQLSIKN